MNCCFLSTRIWSGGREDGGELQKLGGGEIMVLGVRRGEEILREELEHLCLERDALIAISRTRSLPAVIERDVERVGLI